MNVLPLKELSPEETKVLTLNLLKTMDPNDVQNEKSRGQIILEATYKPFKEEDMEKESMDGTDDIQKAPEGTPAGGGLLNVIVHEAQNLEGKHHTNPYAKIIFKGEEKKTKVTMVIVLFCTSTALYAKVVILFHAAWHQIYSSLLGDQEEQGSKVGG